MTGEIENTKELEINNDFEVKVDIENSGELEIEGEAENELEMEQLDGFEVQGELENDFEMEDKADLELNLDHDAGFNKNGFANGARGFLGRRGFGGHRSLSQSYRGGYNKPIQKNNSFGSYGGVW